MVANESAKMGRGGATLVAGESLIESNRATTVALSVTNISPRLFGLISITTFGPVPGMLWLCQCASCPNADLWFPPRRRADLSVSLLAGTPPCSCRYLAQPLLPRWRAASIGVIICPLLLLMTGFSSAWLSSRICNTPYFAARNVKSFLIKYYSKVNVATPKAFEMGGSCSRNEKNAHSSVLRISKRQSFGIRKVHCRIILEWILGTMLCGVNWPGTSCRDFVVMVMNLRVP